MAWGVGVDNYDARMMPNWLEPFSLEGETNKYFLEISWRGIVVECGYFIVLAGTYVPCPSAGWNDEA